MSVCPHCQKDHGLRPEVIARLDEPDAQIKAIALRAEAMKAEFMALPVEQQNDPRVLEGAGHCSQLMFQAAQALIREQQEIISAELSRGEMAKA